MITTIIIFIVILGVLVFVHEAGHFFIAKRSGMKVDEFGFGFPPRLFGIQRLNGKWKIIWAHKGVIDASQTVYSINAIPLGGFVKIVGENNDSQDNPQSFTNKKFFPRLLTLLGGVLMNVVLAWVLFSIGFATGLPTAVDSTDNLPNGATLKNPITGIVEVAKDSPAQKAGLAIGDSILSINDQAISTTAEAKSYIIEHKGQTLNFQIKHGETVETKTVESLANPPEGQGPTGIAIATLGTIVYPWYQAIWEGAKNTVYQLGAIINGIVQLFASGVGLSSLGGPIKIAQITGQVAALGFSYLLQFTAFLSLNLAILNALPFPALDGGRVLFLIIEKLRGKPNNQTAEQIANTAGFFALLLLMAIVTVKDINGLGGVVHIISKLFGS